MTTKTKVIILVVYTAVVFASGRYTVPEKIKIETKIVEVEKKKDDKKTQTNKDTHKKTVISTIKKPDGTEKTVTVITDDSTVKNNTEDKNVIDLDKNTDTKSETTRGNSKVTVSALAGFDFRLNQPVYGASLTKPVIGPFTIGVWALTQPSFGASVGLSL